MRQTIAVLLCVCGLAFAQDPPPPPVDPVITWGTPGQLRNPAPLTTAQLNATANVPGTFTYDPAAGTILPVGAGQTLSVTFTPHDTVAYNTVTRTVTINVVSQYWPYPTPEAVAVCHMDIQTRNLVNDPVTGAPRCFVISAAVADSITHWMLTQSTGVDEQGLPAYKWDSWWQLLVNNLSRRWVTTMIDEFPPAQLVTAKEAATAAEAAFDLTRANLIAALTYFKCTPNTAPSGTNVTCRVVLTGAATTPLTVAIGSNSSSLTVPATVTIAADTTGFAFTAQATGTVTTNQTATVTATLNGITKQSVVTVTPPTP